MKINRLDYTKSLYPHFFDKTDESNFTKHLKVVGKPQYNIRHKLKAIEWSRILEKPLQIWKEQSEPYVYTMHFKSLVPYLKEFNIYKNPIISDDEEVVGYEQVWNESFDYEDKVQFHERTLESLETKEYFKYTKNTRITPSFSITEGESSEIKRNTYVGAREGEGYIPTGYILKLDSDDILPSECNIYFTASGSMHGNHIINDPVPFKVCFKDEDNEILQEIELRITGSERELSLSLGDSIEIFSGEEYRGSEPNNVNKPFKLSFVVDCEYSFNIKLTDCFVSHNEDIYSKRIIPNDTFLLEIKTWDDYHFLKGFPENDYTVKEDNILWYRHNETFLSIKLEEISYSKYLTFRVHKDRIKDILIRKNEKPIFKQEFITDRITNRPSQDFSYTFFDDSITNEYGTYNSIDFIYHYEVEDYDANNIKVYFAEQENDEYVFRLPLKGEDFDENGIVKDTYDLEVTTYEKRYHCLHEYDRMYSKRYNGYDTVNGDCFDHDYSLDIIGALLNVPRLRFYQIYKNNNYYLSRTYPSYNNRSTEDDYHYMKRMQYYISNYNHIVFPVLEFWKWYQTDATIRSRRHILAEMDYTYFRTAQDEELDVCGTDFIDDEFEDAPIVSYSVNKATRIEGEIGTDQVITKIETDDETGEERVISWYEAIVVDRVYVVPNTNYRFRYGIIDNTENVNVRLVCYNREGTILRTTNINDTYAIENEEEEHYYNTDQTYHYYDLNVKIPSDAVSIQLILESDNTFSYKDATFERITISNFDNGFIVTDEDYNSSTYEMYAIYENIPSNIRIGGSDRFNILFKRSLPLTKRGFFYMDINQRTTTTLKAETDLELYVSNILGKEHRSGEVPYEVEVKDFVQPSMEYLLEFTVENEDVEEFDDTIVTTTEVTYMRQGSNEDAITETLGDRIYSDTPTRIRYKFTTPLDVTKFYINITNTVDTTLSDIRLSRVEELMDSEVIEKL